ncbi:hypothetical protein ACQKGO_14240 [Corallococcus interemptor]
MRDFYEGFEGEPEIRFVAKVKGVPDEELLMSSLEAGGEVWITEE